MTAIVLPTTTDKDFGIDALNILNQLTLKSQVCKEYSCSHTARRVTFSLSTEKSRELEQIVMVAA